MMNLDKIKEQKTALATALAEAARSGDEKQIAEAMSNFTQFVSDTVMEEAKGINSVVDRNILAARGVRQLTAEETEYYDNFIKAAKANAQTVITNIDKALPQTVIDSVMDDMRQAHPLLNLIDFQQTGATVKWILNAKGAQSATWGPLNSEITKDLAGAIDTLDLTLCKLSAYMFTTQDMLDLGPVWVDRYIRAILVDALAVGFETGMVDGNGKDMPIGMTRDFTADYSQSTGYPRKTAVPVASFSPAEYGSLLDTLTVNSVTGKRRTVSRVILVVNPSDYFTKIFPCTTLLTPNGQYVKDVLPFPTDIVQSVAVPAGHAVLGVAKDYFMAVGTIGKEGRIEYSDEYKFLEDLRTYKIKFHGNGRAQDINSFVYLDISDLKNVFPTFNTIDVTPKNP